MNIGFIGLGLMGKPMAMHLEKAGHTLHLWARRSTTLAPFAGLNAQTHASPAEVALHAEVVFTMVADGPDVAEVCFGEQGLVAGARPRLIVVDMSTIAPQAARDIGRRLAEHGIDFLDAPVSGGESGGIQATLTIMVGGRADVLARVEPLFACLGKTITLIGDIGAGQVAKACNQIVGPPPSPQWPRRWFSRSAAASIRRGCARQCWAASPRRGYWRITASACSIVSLNPASRPGCSRRICIS